MNKVLVLIGMFFIISGCGSTNVTTMQRQNMASNTIGLASTDELTIKNVKEGQPDSLGAVLTTYEAHTARGKIYKCSYRVSPGLTILDKPTITNHECTL